MRFIHTADWQIGRIFRFVDDHAVAGVLQEARVEAISRLAALARTHGAPAVLVAGDVYDVEIPSIHTLEQPIERMRAAPDIAWHLIPGNHDSHRPNGVWDRLRRKTLPANVFLHLASEPAPLGDDAWLLPAPLLRRHSLEDATAWMNEAATPEGALRIGLAHGTIRGFDDSHGENPANYIDPARPASARLDYLAMGDWHRAQRISERVWYAGTPEADRFTIDGAGTALLVDVAGPGAAPKVEPLACGRFAWHRVEATLSSAADVEALDLRLRGLGEEPGRVLADLAVEGALSLADLRLFEERILQSAAAALRWLRRDGVRLLPKPTAEDLDRIDHGGFVRAAADRLRGMAEDPASPDRELAALALDRLYIEHARLGAGA
jgi:DNA repair exonuclease SbcCD nuclease subunit